MRQLIKWQLLLASRQKRFFVAYLVFLLLCGASFFTYAAEMLAEPHDIVEAFSAAGAFALHNSISPLPMLILYLIPIVAPLAFSDSAFAESAHGTDTVLCTRVSRRRYLWAKAIACFILSASLVLLPLLLNQIWCLIAFPVHSHRNYTNMPAYSFNFYYFWNNMLLKNFYLVHPYLTNVIYMLINALYAGACAVAVFAVSLYTKRLRVLADMSMFIAINLWMILTNTLLKLLYPGDAKAPTLIILDYLMVAGDRVKFGLPAMLLMLLVPLLLSIGAIAWKAGRGEVLPS